MLKYFTGKYTLWATVGLISIAGVSSSRADLIVNWWEDGGVLNYSATGDWSDWAGGAGPGSPTNNVSTHASGIMPNVRRYGAHGEVRIGSFGEWDAGSTGGLTWSTGLSPFAASNSAPTNVSNMYFLEDFENKFRLFSYSSVAPFPPGQDLIVNDSFTVPGAVGASGYALTSGTRTGFAGPMGTGERLTVIFGAAPMASAVPEPSTIIPLLAAVLFLGFKRKRRAMPGMGVN